MASAAVVGLVLGFVPFKSSQAPIRRRAQRLALGAALGRGGGGIVKAGKTSSHDGRIFSAAPSAVELRLHLWRENQAMAEHVLRQQVRLDTVAAALKQPARPGTMYAAVIALGGATPLAAHRPASRASAEVG